MTEEGSKLDRKRERERETTPLSPKPYHDFLPELDDFYTEAFEIT
jgi:hypothetical protein